MTVEDLTAAEVAGVFRVSEQTVQEWARDGKMPHEWVGGRRRFPAAAVAQLAQDHHVPLPDWLALATTSTRQEPSQ